MRGRLFYAGIAAATLTIPLPVFVPQVAGQMPTAGVIDLASWWPNAQMSKTHYLAAPQGDFRLSSTLGNGDFDVFTLGGMSEEPGGGGAWDHYAVFHDIIALVASAFTFGQPAGEVGVIQYLPTYPSIPRYLDLSELPKVLPQKAYYAYRSAGVTTPGESPDGQYVTMSRDGDLVKLHWGTTPGGFFETLWIGDVPIAGTFLTAPGLARYANPDGESTFTWTPRL